MKKSDIAAQVADRTGLSRTDAAGAVDAVDAVFEAVIEALARREQVRIAGFGLFATRYPARPCRAQSAHGRARGGRGFDRADVQAGQGAPRDRERRRLIVIPAGPEARMHGGDGGQETETGRCRNEDGLHAVDPGVSE